MLIDKESLISEAIRLKHDVVDLSNELLQARSGIISQTLTLNSPALTPEPKILNPRSLLQTRFLETHPKSNP
jgi:hypothetical protein